MYIVDAPKNLTLLEITLNPELFKIFVKSTPQGNLDAEFCKYEYAEKFFEKINPINLT